MSRDWQLWMKVVYVTVMINLMACWIYASSFHRYDNVSTIKERQHTQWRWRANFCSFPARFPSEKWKPREWKNFTSRIANIPNRINCQVFAFLFFRFYSVSKFNRRLGDFQFSAILSLFLSIKKHFIFLKKRAEQIFIFRSIKWEIWIPSVFPSIDFPLDPLKKLSFSSPAFKHKAFNAIEIICGNLSLCSCPMIPGRIMMLSADWRAPEKLAASTNCPWIPLVFRSFIICTFSSLFASTVPLWTFLLLFVSIPVFVFLCAKLHRYLSH